MPILLCRAFVVGIQIEVLLSIVRETKVSEQIECYFYNDSWHGNKAAAWDLCPCRSEQRQLAAVGKPYTPQDMDLYGELRSEDVNKSLIIGKYFDHHAVVDWCGASGPQLSSMKL
jgi:hypothetical protein